MTVDSDRVTVRARRAIATLLPAPTAAIDVDPPSPGVRAQLIQRMPHGTLGKAEAIYDRPFWRRHAGLSGQAVRTLARRGRRSTTRRPTGSPGSCSASSAARTRADGRRISGRTRDGRA